MKALEHSIGRQATADVIQREERTARKVITVPIPALLTGLGLLVALAVHRSLQMGSLPTGVDGGNWLALGRAMTGGSEDLPNGDIYPPLVPVLSHLLQFILGPIASIYIIAMASYLLVVAVVFFIAYRELGVWGAGAAAIIVSMSRTITEPLAFGGYPQNLALAAGFLGTWALVRVSASRPKMVAGAVTLFVMSALAHHMYFAIAAGGAVVALATQSLAQRQFQSSSLIAASCALGTSMVAALPVAIGLNAQGYAPNPNPSALSLPEVLDYAFRGGDFFWLGTWATGLAIAVVTLTRVLRRQEFAPTPLELASIAWLVPASFGLVLIAESRLLAAVVIPAVLLTASAARRLCDRLIEARPRLAVSFVIVATFGFALLLPALDRTVQRDFDYYRAVSRDYLAATDWSYDNPAEGYTAVRANGRNWPVGWWWRGLTDAHVLVGSSEKWLAFERERQEARAVEQIFAAHTATEAAHIAHAHGVSRLVADREEWIGWQTWLQRPGANFTIVYQNATIVVLDLVVPKDS